MREIERGQRGLGKRKNLRGGEGRGGLGARRGVWDEKKKEVGEGSKGGLRWEKQGVCQEGGRGEPSGTSFPRARVSSGCPCGTRRCQGTGTPGAAALWKCGAVMVLGGWHFVVLSILRRCFQMRCLSFVHKKKSQREICRK